MPIAALLSLWGQGLPFVHIGAQSPPSLAGPLLLVLLALRLGLHVLVLPCFVPRVPLLPTLHVFPAPRPLGWLLQNLLRFAVCA